MMLAFFMLFVALGRLYRDMLKKPETRALLIMAGSVVIVGILFYTQVEKWSLLDAFYFCVVTLGTVGYGDLTPKTDVGKFFTAIYIIFGVAVIGGFFATAGQVIRPGKLFEKEIDKMEKHLQREAEAKDDAKQA